MSDKIIDLPDVQNKSPKYNISIQQVGISDLKLPVVILNKDNTMQNTIANVEVTVSLPGDKKGTHMSRFPIILYEYSNRLLNKATLHELGTTICQKLESDSCNIEFDFDFFVKTQAPVSKRNGLLDVHTVFALNCDYLHKYFDFQLTVITPTISCCPCSKEIAENNAHNQRCNIMISISNNSDDYIWIEDLVQLSQICASCQIYPVLKRPDEKYVTEYMYQNPYFVEDIARNVAVKLYESYPVEKWVVRVTSMESIHNHNATAQITNITNEGE